MNPFYPGEWVRVVKGPLAGQEGYIQSKWDEANTVLLPQVSDKPVCLERAKHNE